MADEDDLIALENGDSDMVKRDFRGANLSGRNLTGRDFTHAHFQNANVSRADLSNSILSRYQCNKLNAEGAIFRNVICETAAHVGVNFKGADLRASSFESSVFARCDFSSTDLRGADFSACHMNEGTIFSGALSDETTKFDGISIFRPLARDPVFRYYKVERGILVRKALEEVTLSNVDLRNQINAKIDVIERELTKINFSSNHSGGPGLGHNNPPEEVPFDVMNRETLRASLQEIRLEIKKDKPEKEALENAIKNIASTGANFLKWVSGKLDVAAEAFAKKAGESLASKSVLISSYLIFSGHLDELKQLLWAFLNFVK